MAGSYNHIVDKYGRLRPQQEIVDMLGNGGDGFEVIEEMYSMIWYLGYLLKVSEVYGTAKDAVDEAHTFYKEGLKLSPSTQYKDEPKRCPTCQVQHWSLILGKWIYVHETPGVCKTCGHDYSKDIKDGS